MPDRSFNRSREKQHDRGVGVTRWWERRGETEREGGRERSRISPRRGERKKRKGVNEQRMLHCRQLIICNTNKK